MGGFLDFLKKLFFYNWLYGLFFPSHRHRDSDPLYRSSSRDTYGYNPSDPDPLAGDYDPATGLRNTAPTGYDPYAGACDFDTEEDLDDLDLFHDNDLDLFDRENDYGGGASYYDPYPDFLDSADSYDDYDTYDSGGYDDFDDY